MNKKSKMTSNTNQSAQDEKSQVRDTSGGEMPDPNQTSHAPRRAEVESAFKNPKAKGTSRK